MATESELTQGLPRAFEGRLALLLHKLGCEVLDRAESELEALGIDGRAYVVLALLADDQPASQQDLARLLGKVPGLVVSIIDQLEAAGLVVRERSTEDRRRTVVALTPRGRRILERADGVGHSIEDELLGTLSADERRTLQDLVRRAMRASWRSC